MDINLCEGCDKIKELEEKDKIIDLMAEYLITPIHSKEWVKKYYKKLVQNK